MLTPETINEIFAGVSVCLSAIFGTGTFAIHKKHKKTKKDHEETVMAMRLEFQEQLSKQNVKIEKLDTRVYEQSKTIFQRIDKVDSKLDKIDTKLEELLIKK